MLIFTMEGIAPVITGGYADTAAFATFAAIIGGKMDE